MKHLKTFENAVNEFKPKSFKDRILSFLPPALRREVSFSEGMEALHGLTNDYSYIIMAIRARLKSLNRKAELDIDETAYKAFRMQLDELEMAIHEVYKQIEDLEKWNYGQLEAK